jgi:toxin-antitoxin system PIN domain toxin
MISVDTNLLIYAADPDCPQHHSSRGFLQQQIERRDFALCELVLVELYMQLRNPRVFRKPYTAIQAASYCQKLRKNPYWRYVDYDPAVRPALWRWAAETESGFRHIIDVRIALTLMHHGVKEFATANTKDFENLGFERVWNPLAES